MNAVLVEAHRRADLALESFLVSYWDGGQPFLWDSFPDASSPRAHTQYWDFARGFETLADGVERTRGQKYAGLLETFYLAHTQQLLAPCCYDDEAWMVLALVHASNLARELGLPHDLMYLDRAKLIYGDVMKGWGTNCCGRVPGGIWFQRPQSACAIVYYPTQPPNCSKSTAANAGAALAGALLFQRTADPTYLTFARQVYDFWFANMVDPQSFHVFDSIHWDGTVPPDTFTYNEGLMIGAGVELFRALALAGRTQEAAGYLAKANSIAGFMLSPTHHEVVDSSFGRVLHERLYCHDCAGFKGAAYRYLMDLYDADATAPQFASTRSHVNDVLFASAQAVWDRARNGTLTIFGYRWDSLPPASATVLQESSALTALNRWAESLGAYTCSEACSAANEFEAENATVWRAGLEATHGGFSGWGYVAGWIADGSYVRFLVTVPRGGLWDLTLRYAAGAGRATRLVCANGTAVVAALDFPATSSWDAYGVSGVSGVPLHAGVDTVAVAFDGARGSANFLNLDRLTLAPSQSTQPPAPAGSC